MSIAAELAALREHDEVLVCDARGKVLRCERVRGVYGGRVYTYRVWPDTQPGGCYGGKTGKRHGRDEHIRAARGAS